MKAALNKPAEFTNKTHAKNAMSIISGPQVVKKEVVGGNIKITWSNGTTSLAPAWWFHRGFEESSNG